MVKKRLNSIIYLSGLVFLLHWSCRAEVSFYQQPALNGPNYLITAEQGEQFGNNLFHHFNNFSLHYGESATFTGSNQLENIISRVSGDNPSYINGDINSLPSTADFWFINPQGIILGQHASLNVGGAVHLSTADYIRFEDNQIVYANSQSQSQLTMAAPQSFGFIDNLSAIQLKQVNLDLEDDLSLSAGKVIGNGHISTIDKGIRVAAIESGELDLSSKRPTLSENTRLGNIKLGNFSDNYSNNISEVSFSNFSGGSNIYFLADTINLSLVSINSFNFIAEQGSLSLYGREINLTNSQLVSIGEQEGEGNDIEVFASQSLSLKGDDSLLNSTAGEPQISSDFVVSMPTEIFSGHQNEGRAGNIIIKSPTVELDNAVIINQPYFKKTEQESITEGNSGAILMDVEKLSMRNGAVISTFNLNSEQGGLIKINASDSILIEDNSASQATHITAGTSSSGSAGQVIIDTKNLTIDGGAILAQSNTEFGGIIINPDDGIIPINIDGSIAEAPEAENINNEMINEVEPLNYENNIEPATTEISDISISDTVSSDSFDNTVATFPGTVISDDIIIFDGDDIFIEDFPAGNAGDITINTKHMTIRNGGQIATRTFTSGNAGSIAINAEHTFSVEGEQFSETGVFAGTEGSGDAGMLTIQTDQLNLLNGEIRSDSGRKGMSIPENLGDAGGIKLLANNINIKNGSTVSSTSYGDGNGGQIQIKAHGQFKMSGSSQDLSEVDPTFPVLDIFPAGNIEAANYGNNNQPGNINIEAANIQLQNGAYISSQSFNQGAAGSITLLAHKDVILRGNSSINTDSISRGGNISVQANDIVLLSNSNISAASYGPDEQHNSGNLSLYGNQVVVLDNALLEASALVGNGGNIQVRSKHFIKNNHTQLDASSDLGVPGSVEIDTITTDINSLANNPKLLLPEPPILLEEPCRQRKDPGNQHSSLIIEVARPKVVMKNGQLVFHNSEPPPCTN